MFSIISGIGEVVVQFLVKLIPIGIKLLYIGGLVISFIMIFNIIESALSVVTNMDILYEIMGIIQIWLPFDLGKLLSWLMGAASLFILYYLYVMGWKMISELTRS